jgi:GAF domain-containing protein
VPLVSGQSLVGVLTLYASRPGAFSDDQCRLLQMIAPHVAGAVANARRRHDGLAGNDPVTEKRSANGPLRLVAASR